jgi:REP element-mobilizing transposase RayT
MSHHFIKLYYHFVWGTWNREPMLGAETESIVYDRLRHYCLNLNCHALALGGTENHIHLLANLTPTLSISDFVKGAKSFTSYSVNAEARDSKLFKWQSGYGAFTVSASQTERVKSYILNQKRHHAEGTLWRFGEWPLAVDRELTD